MIKSRSKNGDYGRCSCLSINDFPINSKVEYIYGQKSYLGCKAIVMWITPAGLVQIQFDDISERIEVYPQRLKRI